MILKTDTDGHAILQDGKPVYVREDGKEIAFDGAQAFGKIGQLTGENTGYRKRFEEAESRLKSFDGIADPEAARKALETLSSLDQKKLIDAGEVEKVKGEISKGYEAKLTAAETRAQQLEQQLYAEKVGGAFSRSKFIADKLAIPPDMAQARFGRAFGIEEGGRIFAKDDNGNKLYSQTSPGELAGFDEAIELLVAAYPYRDSILKGTGASGGGAGSSGSGAGRNYANTDWSKASTKERVALLKAKNPNL